MEVNDQTAQFMVDLSNNFLKYFKKLNGKQEELNMFDGIDPYNDESVNFQLESFYEEMVKFKMLPDSKTQIYKYEEIKNLEDNDELYSIILKGEQIAVSQSLFALLIELTNLQYENPKNNYEIICLS